MVEKTAIYEFYWYELDQPIEVGEADDFIFNLEDPLKFYSGLHEEGKSRIFRGKVTQIEHKELGRVTKIDTTGLDYTVTLENGFEIEINAEEEPGQVMNYKLQPEKWDFSVQIEILD